MLEIILQKSQHHTHCKMLKENISRGSQNKTKIKIDSMPEGLIFSQFSNHVDRQVIVTVWSEAANT